MAARMKERYTTEIVPALQREFEYANIMQVPRLHKATVNVGLGEVTRSGAIMTASS